jgi:hypothetical protein
MQNCIRRVRNEAAVYAAEERGNVPENPESSVPDDITGISSMLAYGMAAKKSLRSVLPVPEKKPVPII